MSRLVSETIHLRNGPTRDAEIRKPQIRPRSVNNNNDAIEEHGENINYFNIVFNSYTYHFRRIIWPAISTDELVYTIE